MPTPYGLNPPPPGPMEQPPLPGGPPPGAPPQGGGGTDWAGILGKILPAVVAGGAGVAANKMGFGLEALAGFTTGLTDELGKQARVKREGQFKQDQRMLDLAHTAVQDLQGKDLSQFPALSSLVTKYRGALAKASPGGETITPKEASEIVAQWTLSQADRGKLDTQTKANEFRQADALKQEAELSRAKAPYNAMLSPLPQGVRPPDEELRDRQMQVDDMFAQDQGTKLDADRARNAMALPMRIPQPGEAGHDPRMIKAFPGLTEVPRDEYQKSVGAFSRQDAEMNELRERNRLQMEVQDRISARAEASQMRTAEREAFLRIASGLIQQNNDPTIPPQLKLSPDAIVEKAFAAVKQLGAKGMTPPRDSKAMTPPPIGTAQGKKRYKILSTF